MIATAHQCPKCSGPMWDETKSKFYDPAKNKPIAKCKDRSCDGVIWPPRNAPAAAPTAPVKQAFTSGPRIPEMDGPTDIPKLERLFALYGVCLAEALQQAEKMSEADIGCTPETVASMAATLFIQATKL